YTDDIPAGESVRHVFHEGAGRNFMCNIGGFIPIDTILLIPLILGLSTDGWTSLQVITILFAYCFLNIFFISVSTICALKERHLEVVFTDRRFVYQDKNRKIVAIYDNIRAVHAPDVNRVLVWHPTVYIHLFAAGSGDGENAGVETTLTLDYVHKNDPMFQLMQNKVGEKTP
nr:hypothetical protein [Candidatus Sigynarchaeota archaeon]